MNFKKLSDQQLSLLVHSGNHVAFTELYNRHYARIFSFIRKYLKSTELSDDITQNVFISIWEQKEELPQVKEFAAYAFTIAKRKAFDFLKRSAVEVTAMEIIMKNIPLPVSSVEDQHQTSEYMAFIESVVTRMPLQTQEVFKLCRQQQHSYDEAAAILGISRNAIKKHMVRSMKVLKEAAEGELGVSLSVILIALALKR